MAIILGVNSELRTSSKLCSDNSVPQVSETVTYSSLYSLRHFYLPLLPDCLYHQAFFSGLIRSKVQIVHSIEGTSMARARMSYKPGFHTVLSENPYPPPCGYDVL